MVVAPNRIAAGMNGIEARQSTPTMRKTFTDLHELEQWCTTFRPDLDCRPYSGANNIGI